MPLAALMLVLAYLFAFDLLPPAQEYGPWHGTVMALLEGGVAGFFGWCARCSSVLLALAALYRKRTVNPC